MLASAGLCVLSAGLHFGAHGSLALLAVLVVINRLAFAPLMPYEIDEKDYTRLMEMAEARQPGSAYLVPWQADYCYLAFTFPERVIVLTQGRTTERGFKNPEFRRWVGAGRYAGSLEELSAVPQPWVYIGWTYNPTVLALKERLRWLRIGYIARIELDERLRNHLEQSWIWDQDDLRLREIAMIGRYYGFQVVRDADGAAMQHQNKGKGSKPLLNQGSS
jgi:hypothetical protein